MQVLTNGKRVIMLQYINVSNQHIKLIVHNVICQLYPMKNKIKQKKSIKDIVHSEEN